MNSRGPINCFSCCVKICVSHFAPDVCLPKRHFREEKQEVLTNKHKHEKKKLHSTCSTLASLTISLVTDPKPAINFDTTLSHLSPDQKPGSQSPVLAPSRYPFPFRNGFLILPHISFVRCFLIKILHISFIIRYTKN